MTTGPAMTAVAARAMPLIRVPAGRACMPAHGQPEFGYMRSGVPLARRGCVAPRQRQTGDSDKR